MVHKPATWAHPRNGVTPELGGGHRGRNDDPDAEEEDLTPEARLAPGEALLVRDGAAQQRASVTDENTEYIALELVPLPTDAPTTTVEPTLISELDSDADRLSDGDEVYVYGTSQSNPNTDGDQCQDGAEVLEGLGDPLGVDCTIII